MWSGRGSRAPRLTRAGKAHRKRHRARGRAREFGCPARFQRGLEPSAFASLPGPSDGGARLGRGARDSVGKGGEHEGAAFLLNTDKVTRGLVV